MTNKTQQTFQREINIQRQQEVADQIEKSKTDGTYTIGPDVNEMISTFEAHIKALSSNTRGDRGINLVISQLSDRFETSDEAWISRRTNVHALISLIVTEYVTARLLCGLSRHNAVVDLSETYGISLAGCQLLLEEFAIVFTDKIERIEENPTGSMKFIIFKASDEFAKRLELLEERIIMNQKSLWPMTEQPADWTGFVGNPYGDPLLKRKMIRKSRRSEINVEEAAKVLNALQKSEFKINKTVLEFAKKAYKEKDLDVFKSKSYSTWSSREAVRGGITSARRKIAETFKAASYFAKGDTTYYIPYCLDYRGRVYPMNTVLSSQGTELEKALFSAATPMPLGVDGGNELLIQLATAFGSKAPLADRIIESQDRLDRGELTAWLAGTSKEWQTADEPFLALATAEALLGWAQSDYSDEYESSVLVFIDASNSGFQLCAGMLRDEKLAPLVNLKPSDTVGDLYTEVAKEVRKHYKGPLKSVIKDRKVWKRPVMCLLYSLTYIGAWKYLADELDNKVFITEPTKIEDGEITKEWKSWKKRKQSKTGRVAISLEDFRAEVTELTHIFFKQAMPSVAPQGFRVLDTVQSWSKQLAKLDTVSESGTITWTTPGGMTVHQTKRKMVKQEIKSTLSSKVRVCHIITTESDKIDKAGHTSSIVPNMIHSIDAALIWNVSKKVAAAGFVQAPCHDAFSTTAGQASELGRIVREGFIELVESNPLQQIKEDLEARYGISLDSKKASENLPTPGKLDLADIVNTDHSFR